MTGPSQDELCLIEMASKTGLCEFVDRNSAMLTIKVMGEIEEYRNIKFFDFTSARKMMTRVVQNVKTGKVIAMTKGADSAIISKSVPRQHRFNCEELEIVEEVENFAAQGFRTLMFA